MRVRLLELEPLLRGRVEQRLQLGVVRLEDILQQEVVVVVIICDVDDVNVRGHDGDLNHLVTELAWHDGELVHQRVEMLMLYLRYRTVVLFMVHQLADHASY